MTDPFGNVNYSSISWKDQPVGTTVSGTVVEAPKLVQARDYESGEPAFWKDGNPKQTVVTILDLGGEEPQSLWASVPSALQKAIAQAQKDAGAGPIAVGGKLSVTFTGEKKNDNPRLNAQKLYSATYRAPVSDPFAADAPIDRAKEPELSWVKPTAANVAKAEPVNAEDGEAKVAQAKELHSFNVPLPRIAEITGLSESVLRMVLAS